MRVALVTPTYWPNVGGMERFADDLAAWLVASGHDVTVYTPVDDTAEVHPPSPFRVVRGPLDARLLPALRKADAVHANGLSIRASALARAAWHRPVVTHAHHQAICPAEIAWNPRGPCTAGGSNPGPCGVCYRQGRSARRKVRIQRVAAQLAGVNVAISEYLARRIVVPRTTVIYNPVSPDAFSAAPSPSRPEEARIAYAGRIANEKGVDILVRALARLPDAQLEIAGDGPMRADMERLVDELGVRRRVRFLGAVDRAALVDLYGRSTVACVPTACEEPFGYAAAEAMALGRAVVATPSGAMVELLQAGRGFLADAATPAALTEALTRALEDDEARSTSEERAHGFARANLHVDVVGPRYLAEYEHTAR